MLRFTEGHAHFLCARREFIRISAGLCATGLVLTDALPGDASPLPRSPEVDSARGAAKSCILVYLLGGPPHLDMWDLKPAAPAEIRGPFQPIPTRVPGVSVCEHLPRLARLGHKYALVRSVSHRNSNHTPMIYYTLTGYHTAQPSQDNDVRPPQRTDFPHMGSILARFQATKNVLPEYVALPEVAVRSSVSGAYKRARFPLRGGGAGFLGSRYEALALNGEPGTPEALAALHLPKDVSAERFEQRRSVLSLLDRALPRVPSAEQLATIRQRAILLTGTADSEELQSFSLDREPPETRERYGPHRFGRALLLARRLAEAGVPMIAIHFNEMTICDGWDTHSKNFEALQEELLPMLDQSLSALIEDLDQRGRLNETLVVCLGEFGRTPKINKDAGRDHWGECSSALLAGGGIRGGQVFGSSDKYGALPQSDPVDPVDIQATIYRCMGLDPGLVMHDHLQRPFPISNGRVIEQLL